MEEKVIIPLDRALLREIVEEITSSLEELTDAHPVGPDRGRFNLATHIAIGAMWSLVLDSYTQEEKVNVTRAASLVRSQLWPTPTEGILQ